MRPPLHHPQQLQVVHLTNYQPCAHDHDLKAGKTGQLVQLSRCSQSYSSRHYPQQVDQAPSYYSGAHDYDFKVCKREGEKTWAVDQLATLVQSPSPSLAK